MNECFLVDIEFKDQLFIVKSLNCLLNFIYHDSSSKPWNRCGHFEAFIKPEKNILSLKDHRFNRLAECAMAASYYIDEIAAYLEEYKDIINGITIFDQMEGWKDGSFEANLHGNIYAWYSHF